MTSVKKSVLVQASRDVAFRVFTERMALWWPPEHHIGKSALETIVLEPRVSGRWAERCADGSECEWGRVLAWEPPSRVVLAWQLDAQFRFDASFETEVEILFVTEGERRTRVELEHKHLERYGDAAEKMVASFVSKDGWQLGLDRLASASARAAKKHYLLRLIPPRPTFGADMSDAERRAMIEHVAYWTSQADRGVVTAFGPVADPNGGWGVAIVHVDDDAEIQKLTGEDPAVRHAIGMRYEVLPMPQIVFGR